jgi:RimJ/RimL family protein N-acetyltransferase
VPGDLITDRMVLRRFAEADLHWLAELHGDPAVMRYIDDGKPVPREVVASQTLPDILREYDELPAGLGRYAAVGHAAGSPIGWFGLRPPSSVGLDSTVHGELELGYRLLRSCWGRGYAIEGARALIGRAFGELGAQRVVATTMAVNTASRRVLEATGFTLVRTFFAVWPDYIEGAEHGDVVYRLTRQEWLSRG